MEISTNKESIKSWAEDDRPREKLLLKGRESVSDAELIAILISSGSKNESAVSLSKRILKTADNDLNKVGRMTVGELQRFKGIGEAKAVSIAAALELGRRRKSSNIKERKKITSSKDVADYFSAKMTDLPYEEFWIMLLNRANVPIDKHLISRGGISGTVADIRLIFKKAIDQLASSIIVCHNHPSGNLKPSEADKKLTTKLIDAGKIVDIPVLDHIIVSHDNYFSFNDEGLLT